MAVNDVERDKAIVLANYIHCSVHEWPTENDVPLLCYALLHEVDQTGALRAELAAAHEKANSWEQSAEGLRDTAEQYKAKVKAANERAEKAEAEAAALRAHVERLRGALTLPEEVIAHMQKLGLVEWGSVPARSDEQHVSDFRDTLSITRDTFGTVGDVPIEGVFLQNTSTVVCHTGTSPNSAKTARIMAGLWNSIIELQSTLAASPAQSMAACKADALREAAKECQEVMPDDLPHLTYNQLMEMAERLQAEAANG